MTIPDEILTNAEKAARQAIDDFTLAHSLKPNALMVGKQFAAEIGGAIQAWVQRGQTAEIERRLPLCPATNQRTVAGLPLIISNRADAALCGVLVGNPELLKLPKQPTR